MSSPNEAIMAMICKTRPATDGPVLKINRSDHGVIRRLTELKERVKAEAPPISHYEAPEGWFDKVHVQLPPIVDTLIDKGIVYVWAMAREANGAPYVIYSFTAACGLIAKVEGVEEVSPAAN